MKFGVAVSNTVIVVAYTEYENVIEMERKCNVKFDFSN